MYNAIVKAILPFDLILSQDLVKVMQIKCKILITEIAAKDA